MARKQRPSERRGDTFRAEGYRIEVDRADLYLQLRPGMRAQLLRDLRNLSRQAKIITAGHNHPYSKTKRLSRSIHPTPIREINQSAIGGQVVADVFYAGWVHDGTKRHIIHARPENPTGKLRFFWARRQRIFAGASVDHPGARAKPFMVLAARRTFPNKRIQRK